MPIIRIKEDNPLVLGVYDNGNQLVAELRLEGVTIAGALKIKKGKKGQGKTEICANDLTKDDELELDLG